MTQGNLTEVIRAGRSKLRLIRVMFGRRLMILGLPCPVPASDTSMITHNLGLAKMPKQKPQPEEPVIKYLKELLDKCWTLAPNDLSGIQSHTVVRLGLQNYEMMLDGG